MIKSLIFLTSIKSDFLNFSTKMILQDITWKYKNLTISDNSHYAISKAAKVDGVVSTLKISTLNDGDFGPFKCVINNGHGEDTHTVNLDRIG